MGAAGCGRRGRPGLRPHACTTTAAPLALHVGRPERHLADPAAHLPTIIGAGPISSLRALTLLTPFGDRLQTAPLPLLLGLIAVFAIGILLSMSLFGIAFARLMSASAIARLGRTAAVVMAAGSVALGVFWIVSA
jgi:hypothetical protein